MLFLKVWGGICFLEEKYYIDSLVSTGFQMCEKSKDVIILNIFIGFL
jgi:hypothetical protein